MNRVSLLRKATMVLHLFLVFLLYPGGPVHAREPMMQFDHVLDLGSPGGQTTLQDNDGFFMVWH